MTPHLSPETLILILVDAAGGRAHGKTLLQKRAFFVSRNLGIPAGYRPHYYGPYSPKIDNAIGRAKALGFLNEVSLGFGKVDDVGFEWRRYDYALSDDGRRVLQDIEKHAPRQVSAIRDCLKRMEEAGDNGDYVSLSIAAKTYFIVTAEHRPMSYEEIRLTARKLGWSIKQEEIDKATSFLKQMSLVHTSSNK